MARELRHALLRVDGVHGAEVKWGDGSSNTYTTGGDKTHVYSAGG